VQDRDGASTTSQSYWDELHRKGGVYKKKRLDDYRSFCDRLIFEEIKENYQGGRVIEVGAGSSDWLVHVAEELNPDACVGLDYSDIGCRVLAEKASVAAVKIDIFCADLFFPPESLVASADFVMSFGVVEHFERLSDVMAAVGRYSKPGGVLFTLIPNMAGLNGRLTKIFNEKVYDIHVAHDLDAFVSGHIEAGLDVISAGYLGSSSFGVLSSCFKDSRGLALWFYKQLTRVSKVIWFLESKFNMRLPVSKIFSPYIVVISRVPA
jgi:SAM-dependent methyltransferase